MRFIYFDTKTKNLKNKYLRPTQQAHFPPVNKYKSDGITETVRLHFLFQFIFSLYLILFNLAQPSSLQQF